MTIEEFNQLDIANAQAVLKRCADIPSWINILLAKRPYSSVGSLRETACHYTNTWQWSEIYGALCRHPRIGETQTNKTLSDKEQQYSAREQGELDIDNDICHRLRKGNIKYEQKFGYLFLIRAAGRNAEEVLAELMRRLNNDPVSEQAEVAKQLKQIALLRLKQEVTS